MAANTYLQVTELDFEDIRTNLKAYLSSQDQFKDYDYEGSAMAVLLDLLSYNTHYNAYYLNMIANEMFLDTAQQRDSVVSRAKELGYTPYSSVGASANVQLTFSGVDTSLPQIVVPKNSKFTTRIDDISYTFVTDDNYVIQNSSDTFSQAVTIKEGTPVTHRFTVDASKKQRFILPNENVDISSIVVNVQDSVNDTTITEFTRATNIEQVFSTSPIYFVEEATDRQYEIVFGNGVLGKAVKNGNVVIVDYLVCNGEEANRASTFAKSSLTLEDNISYDSVAVTTNKIALGGKFQEDSESIKFNAPKIYQTQNRLVVASDYQRLILAENQDLQSAIAYGGEEADPPVYGKVYIATKPYGEDYITTARKKTLRSSILNRTTLSIDPVIIDADFTYLIPTIMTYYDRNKTALGVKIIESRVREAIKTFSESNLERFGNKLRYSRFVRILDNITGGEILNNDARITMQNRFVPDVNRAVKVILKFNNPIRRGTLSSSQFIQNGFECYLNDNSNGVLSIYRFNSDRVKTNVVVNAGTVDYTTGTVTINSFAPSAYTGLEMLVNVIPDRLDITPVREQILIMDHVGASITVTDESTSIATTYSGTTGAVSTNSLGY